MALQIIQLSKLALIRLAHDVSHIAQSIIFFSVIVKQEL